MATVITSIVGLRKACENGGTYELGANISSVAESIPSGVTLSLDLKTYNLTGTSSASVLYNRGTLTLYGTTGSIKGGGGTTSGSNKYGGGIYNKGGTIYIYGGNISGNSAYGGGGVYNNTGITYIYGGTVSNNSATYGGGCYSGNGSIVLDQNGVISGNSASTGSGGGLYVGKNGYGRVGGGEIKNNTAALVGGGIASYGDSLISGGTVSGNTATSSGGGVYVGNNGYATISGGTITGNSAPGIGGGVRIEQDGVLTMSAGSIINNYCTNSSGAYGAGVFINTTGTGTGQNNFTMSGGVISGNYGCDYGGGVSIGDGTGASVEFIMTGGEIKNNTSRSKGAGVYCDSYSYFKVSGTPVVMDNKVNSNQNNVYLSALIDRARLVLIGSLTGGEVHIRNPLGSRFDFGVTESASYTGYERFLGDNGKYQGALSGTNIIEWVDIQTGVKVPVYTGGAWHDATPQIYVGGAWHDVTEIDVYTGGAWHKVT